MIYKYNIDYICMTMLLLQLIIMTSMMMIIIIIIKIIRTSRIKRSDKYNDNNNVIGDDRQD